MEFRGRSTLDLRLRQASHLKFPALPYRLFPRSISLNFRRILNELDLIPRMRVPLSDERKGLDNLGFCSLRETVGLGQRDG